MRLWEHWPGWMSDLVWTTVAVAVAYAVGQGLSLLMRTRLVRLAGRTAAGWDDILVAEVRRRIAFWSLLVGLHLALPHWSLSPGVHKDVGNLIAAFAIASVTFALAAVTSRLIVTYGPLVTPLARVSALSQNVVRIVITVLGGLVILRSIYQYDITPYLTALGVGGLAVALALQDPLSNLFAGLFLSVSGQVRLGEYVRLDSGLEGYVLDFNWRATSIRLLSGSMAIVPNAKLAQATVTNFHQPARDLGIGLEMPVDYGSDLALVERVAIEVANAVAAEVPGVVEGVAPVVRFQAFGPSTVTLSVGIRCAEFTDQFLVKHELIKRLHARFVEEHIAMRAPLPHEVVRPHAS